MKEFPYDGSEGLFPDLNLLLRLMPSFSSSREKLGKEKPVDGFFPSIGSLSFKRSITGPYSPIATSRTRTKQSIIFNMLFTPIYENRPDCGKGDIEALFLPCKEQARWSDRCKCNARPPKRTRYQTFQTAARWVDGWLILLSGLRWPTFLIWIWIESRRCCLSRCKKK